MNTPRVYRDPSKLPRRQYALGPLTLPGGIPRTTVITTLAAATAWTALLTLATGGVLPTWAWSLYATPPILIALAWHTPTTTGTTLATVARHKIAWVRHGHTPLLHLHPTPATTPLTTRLRTVLHVTHLRHLAHRPTLATALHLPHTTTNHRHHRLGHTTTHDDATRCSTPPPLPHLTPTLLPPRIPTPHLHATPPLGAFTTPAHHH